MEPEEMLEHFRRREHWNRQRQGDPETAPEIGDHVAVIVPTVSHLGHGTRVRMPHR